MESKKVEITVPAHRKDFSAAVRMYESGKSIAEVADAFSVSRQSMHKVLSRRGVNMRQPNLQPSIEWNGRKFTLREHGYFAETTGDREYLHRAIWIDSNGTIPEGYDVHHKNGDKSVNEIGNFELLTQSDHGKSHGFAGNQYVPSTGMRPVR